MPTSKIKKDSREGKGSVKSLEKKWDKAGEKTPSDVDNPYAYQMSIYKNMTHQASTMNITAAVKRLAATEVQAAPSYPGLTGYIKKVNQDFGEKGDVTHDLKHALGLKVISDADVEALDRWLVANKSKWSALEAASADGEEHFPGMPDHLYKGWEKFFGAIFGG